MICRFHVIFFQGVAREKWRLELYLFVSGSVLWIERGLHKKNPPAKKTPSIFPKLQWLCPLFSRWMINLCVWWCWYTGVIHVAMPMFGCGPLIVVLFCTTSIHFWQLQIWFIHLAKKKHDTIEKQPVLPFYSLPALSTNAVRVMFRGRLCETARSQARERERERE